MRTKARFFYFLLFIFFLQTGLVSTAFATTRIMPLGDSLTVGYDGVILDEPEWVGYREKLYSDLVDEGYDIDFVGSQENGLFADPWHEGYSGWHADQIRDNVYSWLEGNPAEIILLHIGTNDISGLQSAAGVRDEINEILNKIDDYEDYYGTEIMVILARIINRYDPDSLEGQRTTELNGLLQTLANSRSTTGDEILAVDHENALIYPDDIAGGVGSVHPTTTGYHKMADVWFDELVQILPEPNPDPDPPNNSSDSGCFISTATYGLHMEPHTKAPVDFRDHFLLTNFVGRAFVDFYHSIRHLRLISTLDVFIK